MRHSDHKYGFAIDYPAGYRLSAAPAVGDFITHKRDFEVTLTS